MSDYLVSMARGNGIYCHEAMMMAQCVENNTVRPSLITAAGFKSDEDKLGRVFCKSYSCFTDVEERIEAMFNKLKLVTFFGIVSYSNLTGKTELKELPDVYVKVDSGGCTSLHYSRFYKPEGFINGKDEKASSNIIWLPSRDVYGLHFSVGTQEKMAWCLVGDNMHIIGDTNYWGYKWSRSMSIFYPDKYPYIAEEQYNTPGIRYKVNVFSDGKPDVVAREANIIKIEL